MNQQGSTGSIIGALGLSVLVSAMTSAQTGTRVRAPLPLEVAVSLQGHNSRSPIDLSPDGQWVAHTVETVESMPRDAGWRYTASGFPLAEGDARMQATLTNTKTGEAIRLGSPKSATWGAVWSPDGQRVAFYSDDGGQAGVWIWDKATRKAKRFPGVIARPFFGFELAQWTADSQRVVIKILPAGMTVAEANAFGGGAPNIARFPKVDPGQPSVHVRRHDPTAKPPAQRPAGRSAPEGDMTWGTVDLALLDLRTEKVVRLVERVPVRAYALSRDELSVAYTVMKGWESNTQQSNVDVAVVDLKGGPARTLATNVRMEYGIEWSWSPDSRTIAYINSGQMATGEIVLISASDGATRELKSEGVPGFGIDSGEYAPLWSADAQHLYAVTGGKLWRLEADSGRGAAVGSISGWQIRAVIMPYGRPTVWATDGGRTVWAITRERDSTRAGIHAIDLITGQSRAALQEHKTYSVIFNLDACEATGELAFVSTDQEHLHDVWLFNTKDNRARQVSRLNEQLDRYELGQAKIIEWRSLDGESLRGALLLPPGYRAGRRLPLMVQVYGGTMGSTYVNRFGFQGSLPALNMHVLATRGYAVLFPDAPVRTGRTMTDIVNTVMPGVNAAIDQGYADPDRLAVMGQSYGSFNTLSLITQTNRFKAAIVSAAILHPDLFTDYLRDIGYYEQGQGNMGGTIWDQRERYLSNSPLLVFDRIQTPLLIGQGEKDGDLVPAEAIFAALQRLGKKVEYRLYQGEGHVISRRANVLDFWKRRLEFLAEHLDLTVDEDGAVVFDGARAKPRR